MKDATPPQALLAAEIGQAFASLDKAAALYDNRHVSKVLRDLGDLRRRTAKDPAALAAAVALVYPPEDPCRRQIEALLGADASEEVRHEAVPEIVVFVHLLVQVYLLDTHRLEEAHAFNAGVVGLLALFNRRLLDFLQAKVWFYVARTAELRGELLEVRPSLLAALRTATLRHDDETTALLLTLVLRSYLLTHDIAQAANLCEKTVFPGNAGNALAARYYYYVLRISCIQLDYSSAHECVISAVRKAPQTLRATGFLQAATKLKIVIELLMGDIPELGEFRQFRGALLPYLHVTRAVRLGDLMQFEHVLDRYEAVFVKDDMFTLVLRLRQNVIRTGIRIISLAYLKILLKDICIKLHLDLEEATEYIVSKAIRDGVIEASVNHELGYMHLRDVLDVYSTKVPQEELDQRIRFCLLLHTDSVKAMRYPLDDSKQELKTLELIDDEKGLMRALEEGDLDDFMD